MIQSNIDFLEQNRDCHTEIINAQTATKANKIKADLYRIMREEFLPGYSYLDDCGPCLFDMTNLLYRLFDDWKAKQPKEGPINPVPIENIKASFPSHKPEEIINAQEDEDIENVKLPPMVFDDTQNPSKPIHNKKHHRRR